MLEKLLVVAPPPPRQGPRAGASTTSSAVRATRRPRARRAATRPRPVRPCADSAGPKRSWASRSGRADPRLRLRRPKRVACPACRR